MTLGSIITDVHESHILHSMQSENAAASQHVLNVGIDTHIS